MPDGAMLEMPGVGGKRADGTVEGTAEAVAAGGALKSVPKGVAEVGAAVGASKGAAAGAVASPLRSTQSLVTVTWARTPLRRNVMTHTPGEGFC